MSVLCRWQAEESAQVSDVRLLGSNGRPELLVLKL